jgi:hypothetical protein
MRHILLTTALVFLAHGRLQAQSAAPDVPSDRSDVAYCLGFAFGTWKPALDLETAGHAATVDTTHFLRAPGGRDWASAGAKAEGDTTILLFPIWWPAGVVITLAHAPRSAGDTVGGTAVALVADGRKTAPETGIRAWEKKCG